MISRELAVVLGKRLGDGKALVILGPRQTGKTTLVQHILAERTDVLHLNADDPDVRLLLENVSTASWRNLLGTRKVLFVDEAQRVRDIGLKLKLVTDAIKDVQIFVTGSSALELANDINEPLTGRKWEYHLYPISWREWAEHVGVLAAEQSLEQRLVLGMYPEVLNRPEDAKDVLKELAGSYLYRDLLGFRGIRKPELLEQLLRALALQLGSEASLNELAQLLHVDKNTVSTYIDLLEKAFIVFRLAPLKRNLRNEIATTRKIYFCDNGIRNAVIGNLAPWAKRADKGALWENFLMAERRKMQAYSGWHGTSYFWRTTTQQEIDLVEEQDGEFHAFEFKWNPTAKGRIPTTWKRAYPESSATIVNRRNYLPFLGIGE